MHTKENGQIYNYIMITTRKVNTFSSADEMSVSNERKSEQYYEYQS